MFTFLLLRSRDQAKAQRLAGIRTAHAEQHHLQAGRFSFWCSSSLFLWNLTACISQIGGCLIQQDQAEAKANVDKRLDFITSELSVVRPVICRTCDSDSARTSAGPKWMLK